jgi:hypothetical protein
MGPPIFVGYPVNIRGILKSDTPFLTFHSPTPPFFPIRQAVTTSAHAAITLLLSPHMAATVLTQSAAAARCAVEPILIAALSK